MIHASAANKIVQQVLPRAIGVREKNGSTGKPHARKKCCDTSAQSAREDGPPLTETSARDASHALVSPAAEGGAAGKSVRVRITRSCTALHIVGYTLVFPRWASCKWYGVRKWRP
jgi:hypothetical protein